MSDTERHVEDWPGFHGRVVIEDAPLSPDEMSLMRDLGAAGTTRRDFLKFLSAAGISLSAAHLLVGCRADAGQPADGGVGGGLKAGGEGVETVPVTLNVNGVKRRLD